MNDSQDNIRMSEEKFSKIFHSSPDAIVISELETAIIIDTNEGFERITGYSREDVLGKSSHQLNLWVDIEDRAKFTDILKAEGRVDSLEVDTRMKTGEICTHLLSAELINIGGIEHIVTVGRNITELKKAEEKTRSSEERLKILFENTPETVYLMDLKGTFIDFNKAAETLSGYTREEAIGKDFIKLNLFTLKQVSKVVMFLGQIAMGKPVGPEELTLKSKDGIDVEIEIRAYPVTIDNKKLVLGVASDITKRKNTEIELKGAFEEISSLKEQLETENVYLREEVKLQHEHGEILGQSDAIKGVLKLVERVADTDSTVLILGETGTGKELLAQSIHNLSKRKDRPMVKVNCAAIPSNLIESELFGREKGAYTGAITTQVGRFEAANGSTLFLDEIGELSPELQAKLLRVLQDGSLERLGSTKTIKVDVRVISATNRDIEQAVEDGTFRSDLYYRLNVFPVSVPPLRERHEDVLLLVWFFVREFEKEMGRQIQSISKKNIQALQNYSWPGNIRELKNLIERSMILTRGSTLQIEMPQISASGISRESTLDEFEKDYIISVLKKTKWRVRGESGAAKILGLKPTTLDAKMKKLGIKRQAQ